MVRSSPSAGAEMITFFGAAFCDVVLSAFDGLAFLIYAVFLDGEYPGALDYNATPRSPQGILAGSVSLKAFTGLPSMSKASSATSTLPSNWP